MGEAAFPVSMQVIPVALLLLVLTVAFVRHRAALQQQAQGVLWLQALRALITHIQRHRGLSSAVLAGEKVFQGRLAEIQLQVSRDFEQISGMGEWVKHNPSWPGITQHWARLAGNVHKLTVAHTIDQHNRLIKSVLVMIDDIALAHHLYGGASPRAHLWRDLLTLAEYIGQARAVGTALAAGGHDEDDSAYSKARSALQTLDRDIVATLDMPRCRNVLDASSLQNVLDFLSYVDGNLLRGGPLVSASDFHSEATKTLDQLYERFDWELSQISQRQNR